MTSAHTRIQTAASTNHLLRATDLGVPPYALVQAEKAGILERVSPGIYIGPQNRRHPLAEVAGWTLRHPAAVGCLLTAAVYYQLTDAFEGGTWLFVPMGASPPRSRPEVGDTLGDARSGRVEPAGLPPHQSLRSPHAGPGHPYTA